MGLFDELFKSADKSSTGKKKKRKKQASNSRGQERREGAKRASRKVEQKVSEVKKTVKKSTSASFTSGRGSGSTSQTTNRRGSGSVNSNRRGETSTKERSKVKAGSTHKTRSGAIQATKKTSVFDSGFKIPDLSEKGSRKNTPSRAGFYKSLNKAAEANKNFDKTAPDWVKKVRGAGERAGHVAAYISHDAAGTYYGLKGNTIKDLKENTYKQPDYEGAGKSLQNAANIKSGKGKIPTTKDKIKRDKYGNIVTKKTMTKAEEKKREALLEKASKYYEAGERDLDRATKGVSDKKSYNVPEMGIVNSLIGLESTKDAKRKAAKDLSADYRTAWGETKKLINQRINEQKKANGLSDDTVLTNGMTVAEFREKLLTDAKNELTTNKQAGIEKINKSDIGKVSKKDLAKLGIRGGVGLAEMMIPYAGTAGRALKAADLMLAAGKGAGKKAVTEAVETGAKKALAQGGRKMAKDAAKEIAERTIAGEARDKVIADVVRKIGKADFKQNVKREIVANAIQDVTVGAGMDLTTAKAQGLKGEALAKYMAQNAAFNVGFGLPMAAIAGRTTKAGKKAINQQIADTMNAEYKSLSALNKTEARELINLQKMKDNLSSFTPEQSKRYNDLIDKARLSKQDIATVNSKGKVVAGGENPLEVLSKADGREYIKLQMKEAVGTMSKSDTVRLQELETKVNYAQAVNDTVVRNNFSVSAKNIGKATSEDVANLSIAKKHFEAVGDVKGAKRATTLLQRAETNFTRNVEDITKAAEKISQKVNRTVHVESADEIAAAYARVNKKAASVDPREIHGFAEFDDAGNIIAYHVNKESPQAMAFTLGHEVTHGFESLGEEYTNFANKVREFAGKEWQAELDLVKRNYDGIIKAEDETAFEKEAVANLVGRYLFDNDGKYLNDLLDKEPSLFARIYEYVKKLVTGSSERDAQLDALSKRMDEMFDKLDDHLKSVVESQPAEAKYLLAAPESVSRRLGEGDSKFAKELSESFADAKKRISEAEKTYGNNYKEVARVRKEVFEDTGWWQWVDERWRYEMDDTNLGYNFGKMISTGKNAENGRLVYFDKTSGSFKTEGAEFKNKVEQEIIYIDTKIRGLKNQNGKKAKDLRDRKNYLAGELVKYRAIVGLSPDKMADYLALAEKINKEKPLSESELARYNDYTKNGEPEELPYLYEVVKHGRGDTLDERLGMLFDLYPELKKAKFQLTGKDLPAKGRGNLDGGGFVPDIIDNGLGGESRINWENSVLKVNPYTLTKESNTWKRMPEFGEIPEQYARETLAHEIQHGIQYAEAYPENARPQPYETGTTPTDFEERLQAGERFPKTVSEDDMKAVEKLGDELEDIRFDLEASYGKDYAGDIDHIFSVYDKDALRIEDLKAELQAYGAGSLDEMRHTYVEDSYNSILENGGLVHNKEQEALIKEYIGKDFDISMHDERSAHNLYNQTLGETEARLVESRLYNEQGKTPSMRQRRKQYPGKEGEIVRSYRGGKLRGGDNPFIDPKTGKTKLSKETLPETASVSLSYAPKKKRRIRLTRKEYAKIREQVMAQNSATGNHEHYSVGYGFTDEHYVEFETMGDDSFTPVERIRIDGNEDKIREYARLIDEESGGTDRYLKIFRGQERIDNRNIVEYRNRQSGRRADDVDGEQPGGGISGEDNTESPRNQPESIESGERLKVAENANDYETEPLKSGSFNTPREHKAAQFKVIQENNPALDDVHTAIRSVEDIHTFREVINDSDGSYTPDFTKEMVDDALENGVITVYSSKPIRDGEFVTPSRMMAQDYAGEGRVYSQEVSLEDIAWIDPTEGQMAKVPTPESNTSLSVGNNTTDTLHRDFSEKVLEANVGQKKYNEFERRVRTLQKKGRWNEKSAQELYERTIHPREVDDPKNVPNQEALSRLQGSKKYQEYVNKSREEQIKEQAPTLEQAMENLDKNVLSGHQVSKHVHTIYDAGHYELPEFKADLERRLKSGGVKKPKHMSFADCIAEAEKNVDADWEKVYQRQINRNADDLPNGVDEAERELLVRKISEMVLDGEGDVDKLVRMREDLLDDQFLNGSNIGAALNYLKIWQTKTPEGRATLMLKKVKALNKKYADRLNGKELKLTEEEYQSLLHADDEEALAIAQKIDERLAYEIPATLFEKLNELRKFSMLMNARTHGRNTLGNLVFWQARNISNAMEVAAYKIPAVRNRVEKLGGTVEKNRLYHGEFWRSNKDTLKAEFKQIYGASGSANQYRDIVKSLGQPIAVKNKVLRKAIDFNYKALEVEDMITFKPAFYKAYMDWCDARGITSIDNMTAAQKKSAGAYALQEAEYATFRDDSAFSRKIVNLKSETASRKGKTFAGRAGYRMANIALEGHLPFVKTPVNILRRSIDYSPIGVFRGIAKLTKTESPEMFKEAIHDFCTGMTGSGIACFGMLMASQGHVTIDAGNVKFGEDRDQVADAYYNRDMGYQDYSLVLHNPFNDKDYSCTIDWLSPVQTSFFMGAVIQEKLSEDGLGLEDAFDVGVQVFQPMLDMSFMQTSKDTFESFMEKVYRNGTGDDADWGGAIAQTLLGKVPQGFFGSLVPQMLSQAATASDKYQRDTRSTAEDSVVASYQQWGRQIANKIPVLREAVNDKKIDRFGNDKMNTGGNNVVMRWFNAMINPSNVKPITLNDTDRELINIFNLIPDGSKDKKYFWYPFTGNPDYDLVKEVNGKKRMSYSDLYDYGKAKRQAQSDQIQNMFDAKSYKNMTNGMKVKEIDGYNWTATIKADKESFGADYALEKIVGTKALVYGVKEGPGKVKEYVTDDDRSGGKTDAQAWRIYKDLKGDSDKEKEKFVDFWVLKENMISRAHNTDYHVKGMACALTGNKELARAYDVNVDKIQLAIDYVKKKGKNKAYEQFTDACSNIAAGLDKACVDSTSKANRSWSAAGYKDIDEATYRAMGFDWDSAQSGAGLRNKYGHDVNELIRMASDAKYEFDADKNGSLKKDEVIAYIESLGYKDVQHKACLFAYLSPQAKNPYDSIHDYLKWGENIDDTSGTGRRYGRRGGRGYGRGGRGGGGSGSGSGGGTSPQTASGAITGNISDPFSNSMFSTTKGKVSKGTSSKGRATSFGRSTKGSVSDLTVKSNLTDTYRKKAKKLREASRKA